MELSCHCGGVIITLPHAPDEITHCNCSLCTKTGFRGIYYREDEVTVSGNLDGYIRSEMHDPCLTMWRCRVCGILTHWTLLDEWPYEDVARPDRMGVNARLLDPRVLARLPIKNVDGASR